MRDWRVNLHRCSRISRAPSLGTTRCASSPRRGIRTERIGARRFARDPDATRLIDRLARAGLVSRTRSEENRRCVFVEITDEGRQMLRRLRPRVDRMHREQLGHVDSRDLARLGDLLFRARHP
ncbi:MAG: hypothetical protein CMJ54_03575 [Planctomycetaceae bacterium]|nr:hypothetical protein [Planctomycetaceae bacterium]